MTYKCHLTIQSYNRLLESSLGEFNLNHVSVFLTPKYLGQVCITFADTASYHTES